MGLRCEVADTFSDFREKGAAGAFRDAALDVRDLMSGAGSWLLRDADVVDCPPIVHSEPSTGRRPLETEQVLDLTCCPAASVVVPVDLSREGASSARSTCPAGHDMSLGAQAGGACCCDVCGLATLDSAPLLSCRICDYTVCCACSSSCRASDEHFSLADQTLSGSFGVFIGELCDEIRDAADEIREKGAAGTLRDVATDVQDLVGDAAAGARSVFIESDASLPVVSPVTLPTPLYRDVSSALSLGPTRSSLLPLSIEVSPASVSPSEAEPVASVSNAEEEEVLD